MITPSGLIELDSGWILAIVPTAIGQVTLQLQYDPRREFPSNGLKQIRCSTEEAKELEAALAGAIARASTPSPRPREQQP